MTAVMAMGSLTQEYVEKAWATIGACMAYLAEAQQAIGIMRDWAASDEQIKAAMPKLVPPVIGRTSQAPPLAAFMALVNCRGVLLEFQWPTMEQNWHTKLLRILDEQVMEQLRAARDLLEPTQGRPFPTRANRSAALIAIAKLQAAEREILIELIPIQADILPRIQELLRA